MADNEITTLDHLVRVIGLCQLPTDNWTSHDRELLRDARHHVQKEKEVESRRKEGSHGPVGKSRPEEADPEAEGEVREDRDTVKT